jgi:hypothetical protein
VQSVVEVDAKRSVIGAELGIRHVACVESVPAEFREVHVRVRNLSTRDGQVYRAASGGANAVGETRPAYVASPEGFVWARTNLGSGVGNRIIRYTLRGSRLAYAKGSPRYNSTAWATPARGVATASSLDGSESPGVCSDAGVEYCRLAAHRPAAVQPQAVAPQRRRRADCTCARP